MYPFTTLVRPSEPHLFGVRTVRHVCIRFLEGERVCPVPPKPHTIFRQAIAWKCCLYVLSSYIVSLLTPSIHLVLHDLHLIHTDLKPENILLVHNDYRLAIVPVPGKVSGVRTLTLINHPVKYALIAERSTTDETDTPIHRHSSHRLWFGDL
jgi:serine/threonine protein kinase